MAISNRSLVALLVLFAASLGGCPAADKGGAKETPPSDTKAPSVVAGSPTGVGVAGDTLVTVRFDEPMADARFTTATFTVNDGTRDVEGSVSYDAATRTATYLPQYQLALDTVYTATVWTGVTDVAGNELAEPYSWQFTTAASDTTPPSVYAAQFTTAGLTLWLNEPIDDATAHLVVTDGSGEVAGAVVWAGGALTLTFTPDVPFAAGSNLVATLSAGLEDTSGNATAADRVWSRSLERPEMTGAPTVASATVEAGKALEVVVPVSPETARVEVTLTDATLGDAGEGAAVNSMGGSAVIVRVATTPAATGVFYPRIRVLDPSGLVGTEYALDPLVSETHYAAAEVGGAALGATDLLAPLVTLALDTTPPEIIAWSPEGTGAPCGSQIRFTFDEAIDPATLVAENVIVFDGQERVDGAITWDEVTETVTVSPRQQLAPGRTYLVAVTTGVTDVSGNALARVHSWEFAAEATDTSPPGIWAVAFRRDSITITFTEPIDPATVTVTVTSGGSPFAMVKSGYDPLSFALGYGPSVVYPAIGETLVFTVAPGTKDLSGNAMALPQSFTHTYRRAAITGTPIVPTTPVIAGLPVVITVPITENVAQIGVFLYDAAGNSGGGSLVWSYPFGSRTVELLVPTNAAANGQYYPEVLLYDEVGDADNFVLQSPSPNYHAYLGTAALSDTGIPIPWLQLVVAPNLKVAIDSVTSTGSQVRVAYTVTNSGNAAAGPFSVAAWTDRATAPTVGTSGEGSASHASLGVGASASGTVTISSALLSGKAWAIVDTEGTVTEANETDNVSSAFAWSSPNLTVSLDGAIGSGSTVTVKYTVTNDGDAAAGPFVVGLWANQASAPALSDTPDTTAAYASLAMGASVSGTVAIASALSSGKAWAVVDGAGQVAELNEGDNVSGGTSWPYANLKIRVSGTGFVSGACSPLAPFCTPTADRVSVAYEVKNVGTVAAGAFRVNLWSSRGSAPSVTDTAGSLSANVASLAAGATATGALYFTYSSAGTAWAAVDGGLAVTESWETDNVSAGYAWYCREETAYCPPFIPFCDPSPFVCSE